MAGLSNMKFWYITVLDGMKTIFNKQCLSVGEANALLIEKKAEFPDTQRFTVMRENY